MNWETEKQRLLADLHLCISAEPDHDRDLLCIMEQYLENPKLRQSLLEDLKNLLNHQPYPDPFRAYHGYDKSHIQAMDAILEQYRGEMKNGTNYSGILTYAIAQLNELHGQCHLKLLDEVRGQMVEKLLSSMATTVGYQQSADLLNQQKRW